MAPPFFFQDVVGGRLLPQPRQASSSAGDAPASGWQKLLCGGRGFKHSRGAVRSSSYREESRASHTLPGEGRRVLAADSSAAPGSMSGRLSLSPPLWGAAD